MLHFIPKIQRATDAKSRRDYARKSWEAEAIFFAVQMGFGGETWVPYFQDLEVDQNIFVCKNKGKSTLVSFESESESIIIMPSYRYDGHVIVTRDGDSFEYLGTCAEVLQSLQDNAYTESCYATRTEAKVLHGAGYSEHQKQMARQFIVAADGARDDWLHVCNKLVMACGILKIDLPNNGYQPRDLIKPALN